MRKNLLWALVAMSAALLETTLLGKISVYGVVPDLSVLAVIYFALTEGEERAMFTGVLGGLFQDIASNRVLGHNILCLVLIGYAAGKLSTRLITNHPAVKTGLVFIASLADGLLYVGIMYVQDPGAMALSIVAGRVVPAAFYTALVTPLAFWALDKALSRYFEPQAHAA